MTIRDFDIAVIGMAGRFPGAPDLHAFWANLQAGRECVSHFGDDALLDAGVPAEHLLDPNFVRTQGVLDGAEFFDPAYFEVTPAEAASMDPQHRIFLMAAVHAMEDAGVDPAARDPIGVFAGASMNTYYVANVLPNMPGARSGPLFRAMVANDKDFLATRVAYKLDLTAAAYTVQTACSTSLVAVHLACQSLLNGECRVALAGGSTLKVPQVTGYHYEPGQIFSPTGHLRAFDAEADGIVLGNGVGVVALKMLSDAIADGDRIRAVIKGSATNNDGGFKASYSAPSSAGQSRVIAEALSIAETPADSISYVEAHGTGTALGDPVEIAGLTRAYRETTDARGFCGIGSVKASIGHLDAAAGVAGLIKTVLMLENRTLVPTANFRRPNPGIGIEQTPFEVVDRLAPWPATRGPRRAGVSSFGIGGTNAHVILEEPPRSAARAPVAGAQLLAVSARTAGALERLSADVARALREAPDAETRADIAFTVTARRRPLPHRRIWIIDPTAADPLSDAPAETALTTDRPTVALFFEGAGGRTSAPIDDPVFADAHAACLEALGAAADTGEGRTLAEMIASAHLAMAWGLDVIEADGVGIGALAAAVVAGQLDPYDLPDILAGRDGSTPEGPGGDIDWIDHQTGKPVSAPRDCAGWRARASAERDGAAAALSGGRHRLPLASGTSRRALLTELGRAWLAGVTVSWADVFDGEGRRVAEAPTYPFERTRCWLDAPGSAATPDLVLFEHTWCALPPAGEAAVDDPAVLATGASAAALRAAGREVIELPGGGPAMTSAAIAAVVRHLREAADDRPSLQIAVSIGDPLGAALAGLLRTARQEMPLGLVQVVEADPSQAAEALDAARAWSTSTHVRFDHGRWLESGWTEGAAADGPAFDPGATYLITGGLGGVGRLFADEIARVAPGARILLMGRSAPDADTVSALPPGAEVVLADVADVDAVKAALGDVELRGVLHGAGVIRDRSLTGLSDDDVAGVLRAKVAGLEAIDAATAHMPLAFLVAFSSAVVELGNPGQSAYAAANGFMDGYIARRALEPGRPGRSLAVQWPIWQDGGMAVPDAVRASMARAAGMMPLRTASAMRAFRRALASDASRVLVIEGDAGRARSRFAASRPAQRPSPADTSRAPDADVATALSAALKDLFADEVGWDPAEVADDALFGEYGIDSVVILSLVAELGEIFTGVDQALLFEYRTVGELTSHFLDTAPEEVDAWLSSAEIVTRMTGSAAPPLGEPAPSAAPSVATPGSERELIAIIGLSIRFPGAPDLASFWDRLNAGQSLIGPVPANRWSPEDAEAWRASTPGRAPRTTPVEGGFLADCAGFDAAFFQIAPREAMVIDPQSRMFLEACWQALEDAGYTPDALGDDVRRATGVYGGITKTGYALWSGRSGVDSILHTSFSALVNRVSHALDLGGPSQPVDAMCASSAVAILDACRALRAGEIDLALAGAVNLYLHPSTLAFLDQKGMSATVVRDGAFPRGGDGFVPSEGVGVAVLKRLSDAERDGDDVLAVVRGGAHNHSGRSNAYQAPDVRGQAEVMRRGLRDAGLAPDDIDYLELAALGAEVSDIVEVAAVRRTYGEGPAGHRRMGTLKPIFGHGEAVSGMAQLAKAILQLRHGRILPTRLADDPSDVDLSRVPFAMRSEAEEWSATRRPRRVAIDSFGAGGVNAHLIIEEAPTERGAPRKPAADASPFVFCVSARSEAACRAYLDAWRTHIDAHPELDPARVARVLQGARRPMQWRAACVARGRTELLAALADLVPEDTHGVETAPVTTTTLANADLEALCAAWLTGASVSWPVTHGGAPPWRLAGLPTYPFERQAFWPVEAGAAPELPQDARGLGLDSPEHPLLAAQVEVAGGDALLLTGRLSRRRPKWLADHAVLDTVLVPGTGLLEMALLAAREVGSNGVSELTLAAPLVLPEHGDVAVQVRVEAPDTAGERSVVIHARGDGADWTPCASGRLMGERSIVTPDVWGWAVWPPVGSAPMDLEGLYERLAHRGYQYGAAFRGLREVRRGESAVFARVELPSDVSSGNVVLHPALLDAALHALVATDRHPAGEVSLPFAWTDVTVFAHGCRALSVRFERLGDGSMVSVQAVDDIGAPVLVGALQVRSAPVAQLRAALKPAASELLAVTWVGEVLPGAADDGEVWTVGGAGTHDGRRFADWAELQAALTVGVPSRVVIEAHARAEAVAVDAIRAIDALDRVPSMARDALARVMAILQSVLAEPRLAGAAIVVCTRRAVSTGPSDPCRDLIQAGAWGLVRAARVEHPDRVLRLVDHDDDPVSVAALAHDDEPELAMRAGRAWSPRLTAAEPGLRAPGTDAWRLGLPEGGTLDALRVVPAEARSTALGEGLVRVAVHAAGINFRDALNALGVVPAPWLGHELAGVVVEIGPGVTRFAVGDRVMGLGRATLATVALADATTLTRIPSTLSFVEAATIPLVFATALYALTDLADLKAGERVLVHAAAGGVGMAAVQLAGLLGAEVYGTASPGKWAVLRAMGLPAERIAHSRTLDFADAFTAQTAGAGVDVVLNALAHEFVDASLRLLPRGGRFVEMGKTDTRDPDAIAATHPGVVYRAFDLMEAGSARLGQMLDQIGAWLETGALAALPATAYDLRQAPDAFRFLANGRNVGKLVLTPPRPLSGAGTTLVTGGTGALGRALAAHLVGRHGVRHLVLVGRRGEVPSWIDELGADSVRVVACDVGDPARVAAVLDTIPADRPLRAVFHLAGVIDDGLLAAQTNDRLATVSRPKVDGAWNLHRQTLGLDLDAFVLFSSAAGVLGSPGQSTYAAANAFLDALASHRRASGRPALSLAWGAWAPEGGGMTGRLGAADLDRMKRHGLEALDVDRGLALLDAALAGPWAAVAPMRLNVRAARRAVGGAAPPALLRDLVRTAPRSNDRGRPRADALRARLSAMGEAERLTALQTLVRREAAAALGLADHGALPVEQPLAVAGLDSLMAVELRNRLAVLAGVALPTTLLFDHPTPSAIADLLLRLAFAGPVTDAVVVRPPISFDEPIAIVGMACRAPGGVVDPDGYWSLLAAGRDGIGPFPARWDAEALYDPDPDAPGRSVSRSGGFLDDIAGFDAAFFGIAPREATAMDPQQRLALEVSWEALEAAGIAPSALMGSPTGVYLGAMGSDYGIRRSMDELDGYAGTGRMGAVLAGRLAYTLGLEGPAMTVETACSSSLVAMHLAAAGLRQGECDLALAGGVQVMVTPATFVEFSRQRGLAPDGRCKSFSAEADGVGWAEGVGVLVLKRMSDARRDGDAVLAVLRGSAVNQDGRSQGLTAPNGPSQQRVIRRALAVAGLEPADIDAVEAHGTGTRLGDPIEAGALGAVFGPDRPVERPVWLGSSKSNIGHAQAAAGVLGVMKMVLALQNETLPPTLHAEAPSPHVDWADSGLSLVQAVRPWPRRAGRVRRAGISSFGISGTNAHAVIEEAPPTVAARRDAVAPTLPLVISASSAEALMVQARRWAEWLKARPGYDPAGVLRAAAVGRSHLRERAAVMAPHADGLAALAAGRAHAGLVTGSSRPRSGAVFVCPGHGGQWPAMGRSLLRESDAFADAVDACDAAVTPYTGWSVRAVLSGDDGAPDLDRVDVVQPVLFAMSIGLAAVWRALGVEPAAVVGHSVGEIAAAVIGGALSLGDGARIVALRGKLIAGVERPGGMLSVALSAADLTERLQGTGLVIAVVNGADAAVASGDLDELAALEVALNADGVRCRRVAVGFAAHGRHMDGILDAFVDAIDGIAPRAGEVPLYSPVTGSRIDGETLGPDHWRRNIRAVVRFDRAVHALRSDDFDVFVELGGHPVLAGPLGDGAGGEVVVGAMRRGAGLDATHRALGILHTAGYAIDWRRSMGSGTMASLPTYPFQRQRHWFEPTVASDVREAGLLRSAHALLVARADLAEGGMLLTGRLGRTSPGWLAEHVVFETTVLPGTGVLELALCGAQAAGRAVGELTLQAPLVLPERGDLTMQLEIGPPDAAGDQTLSLYGRPADEPPASWTAYASGRLVAAAERVPEVPSWAAWPPAGTEAVDLEGVYPRLAAGGYRYGPSFQGLRAVRAGDRRVFARVELPETLSTDGLFVHPALLDAALHGLLAAEPGGAVRLPFAWSDVRLFAAGAQALTVCFTVSDERRDVVQVEAIDGSGLPVLTATLLSRPATPEQVRQPARLPARDLYGVVWSDVARPDAPETGERWTMAGRGDAEGRHFGEWGDVAAALNGGAPSLLVIDATAEIDGSPLPSAAGAATARVLEMLRAALVEPRLADTVLVVATRGAVSTAPDDPVTDLVHAPVWGLVRAARGEHPDRVLRLVDHDGVGPGPVGSGDDEPEIAVRNGRVLAPRLTAVELPAAAGGRLSGEGTTLVTGGLGELGQAVARHLVEHWGVRHLMLVSRRGRTPAWVDGLGAETATVVQCDVSDAAQLAAAIDAIPASRPLRAVFHLAGVLDDGLLVGQSAERLAAVMGPKVHGAWHLHQQTAALDLDAFVLFSSAAGVMGSPGQSTYAAANTFLDALATHRRASGRVAQSIAWGLWAPQGDGMTAHLEPADVARLRRQGIEPLTVERGLALLDGALASDEALVAPMGLDVAALRRALGDASPPHMLRALVGPTLRRAASRSSGTHMLRARLAGLGRSERTAAVLALVQDEVATVLGLGTEGAPADRPLAEHGLDSLMAVELRNRLSARAEVALPATLAFDYPTPAAIAELLMESAFGETDDTSPAETRPVASLDEPIAIVGMACRTPGGVTDPAGYWSLLAEGREGIGPFPERWDVDALYDPDPDATGRSTSREGGFLDDIAGFDAALFGIAPREAVAMDPQQRLALEVSWEALEAAGVPPASLTGSPTGVYLGMMGSDYGTHRGLDDLDGYVGTGRLGAALAGRLSYTLGLEGPSMTVETACSSSLVAMHLAATGLRQGECDLALAGGVQVMVTPATFVEFSRLRGLAPDGRCKSFSAEADGVSWAEGVGVVVLKRLSDARRDGDAVLAVLRGSAVNQDGRSQGLTAPNGPSQQRVIRRALAVAGLEPSDIDAIEAHGTGTRLGDPVEAGALGAVFGPGRPDDRPIWLGSSKSNIGHAQAAAGVLGVMKVILALQNEVLPRTLHAANPSPRIEWDGSGLELLQAARAWPRAAGHVRRAGISSFGVSGTNAHVVIEEAPTAPRRSAASLAPTLPLLLSARTTEALRAQARRWADWFMAHPDVDVDAVRRAAATGRSHLGERAAVQAPYGDGLMALADGRADGAVTLGTVRDRRGVVFVFPGQGSQWAGMGAHLLDASPAFNGAIDACEAALRPHTGWSVRAVLRGDDGAPALDRVDVVQPAIFAMAVGLAAVWRELGVEPTAVIGHSQGEIAAAVVAGALSLADGAMVVALRSRLLRDLPGGGGMAVVELPADDAEARLEGTGLSVAVVNTARSTVVAGGIDALEQLLAELTADGVFCRRVDVDYASHSAQVDAILPALADALADVKPQPSTVTMISTVTGEAIDGAALDAGYWCRNLRQPVRLDRALATCGARSAFVEVSPHPVLAMPLTDGLGDGALVVGSLRRDGDLGTVHRGLGALHAGGHVVDWPAVMGPGPMASLPTYAFEHQRYWLEARPVGDAHDMGQALAEHALLRARVDVAADDKVLWTGRLSPKTPRWLGEHAVFDTVLLPGAGLLELALFAAGQVGCGGVGDLTLSAPVAVPDGRAIALQAEVGPPDDRGDRAFALHGRTVSASPDTPWTLHASGRLLADGAAGALAPPDWAAWPPSGTEGVELDGLYPRLAKAGYRYGPAFQGLRAVRTGDDRIYARVALPDDVPTEGHLLHPALLDAALHALLATADDLPDGTVRLPFAWADVTLAAGGARALTFCFEPVDGRGLDEVRLTAVDGAGAPVLQGVLSSRLATVAQVRGALRAGASDLYVVGWSAVSPPDPASAAVTWVLGGVDDGLGENVSDWPALEARLADGTPDRLVIDATSAPDGDDVASSAHAQSASVLRALQSAIVEPRLASTAIVVLTRGAISTGPSDPVDDLVNAPVWGLVRSVRSESPGRVLRLVDHEGGRPSAAVLMFDGEPELAVRADRVLAPRLVVVDASLPTAPAESWHLRVLGTGRLDGFEAVEADAATASLEPGMVRIAVRASAVNFLDTANAVGLVPTDRFGADVAGVVLDVGPGVTRVAVGDRVMGMGRSTFGTVALAEADMVTRMPAGLSFVDAATMPVVFGTALYGLDDLGRLGPGQRVLVHAAAGGVGMAAVQLARIMGADVYGTASPRKWPLVRAMGISAERTANSRTLDYADAFLAHTGGHGVDVVLNALAREHVEASLRLLPRGGRFVEMGKTDIRDPADIARSHPGVVYRAFDLLDAGRPRLAEMMDRIAAWLDSGALRPLRSTVYDLRQAAAAFRHLANGRSVGKLVLMPPRQMSGAGTTLITGGLGELGRAVAEHLVEHHGVRHLLLASRRGRAPAWVDALGAESVTVVACDVGDGEEVAALLGGISADRPLRAVFHLAGLLDDGLLASQTPERMSRVLRPKVDGAWHLHRQTLDIDLDAFVLFSSAAGVLGGPGQTAYAAANAFLDALASHRRGAGLAGQSLAWGLWAPQGEGMTSHLGAADLQRMKRQGIEALSIERGLALLDAALGRPEAALVPMGLDRRRLGGSDAPQAMLSALAPSRLPTVKSAAAAVDWTTLRPEQRRATVGTMVADTVAAVLGHRGRVDPTVGLMDLGLDSLMAVELRNRLARTTGLSLTSTVVFEHPSVDRLSAFIASQLGPDETADAAPAHSDDDIRRALLELTPERIRALGLLDTIMGQAGPAPPDPESTDGAAGAEDDEPDTSDEWLDHLEDMLRNPDDF